MSAQYYDLLMTRNFVAAGSVNAGFIRISTNNNCTGVYLALLVNRVLKPNALDAGLVDFISWIFTY